MNLEKIKRRTEKNVCSIGCYKDLEFLIAKIERMQTAILEQTSLERIKNVVDTDDTPWRKQLSLRIKDLQNFFDVEAKE